MGREKYQVSCGSIEIPPGVLSGRSGEVLPAEIGQTSTRVEVYLEENPEAHGSGFRPRGRKERNASIQMEVYRSRVMRAYNKHV